MNTWHGSNTCHHETMVFQEWGESIKIIKICRDCRDEEGSASDNDNHVNLIGGPTTCAHLSAPTVTSRLNWQRGPSHHLLILSSSLSSWSVVITEFGNSSYDHLHSHIALWGFSISLIFTLTQGHFFKQGAPENVPRLKRTERHHESCPPHGEESQGLPSKPWWHLWRQEVAAIKLANF